MYLIVNKKYICYLISGDIDLISLVFNYHMFKPITLPFFKVYTRINLKKRNINRI